MSNAPMVRPAAAGPSTRAALNIAELRATAVPTSSRPTISTENAWRVGMSTTLVRPPRKARAMTCHTSTRPVNTRPNIANDRPILIACVTISVWRLGRASVMSPPNRPRTMTGIHCMAATTPEQERVAGELEDQPALGDGLHPGADERHELAAEVQAVVAMPEGARAVGERHAGGRPDQRSVSGAWWAAWRLVAGCSCVGSRPASRSSRWPARWARRSSASTIIASSRSILRRSDPTWRSTRASGVLQDRAPLAGVARRPERGAVAGARGLVLEQLADLGQREARRRRGGRG